MMWDSLLQAARPAGRHAKSICGHEYTAANIHFALTIEPDNTALARARRGGRAARSRRSKPTIPTTIGEEKASQSVPARRRAGGRGRASAWPASRAGAGVRAKSARARTSSDRRSIACARSPPPRSSALLDLKPHPEGGHFRETFRDARTIDGGRAASTAIYFLLARGERSHWHRVDAVEVWHYYAGAPLHARNRATATKDRSALQLGPDSRPASGRRASCRRAPGRRRKASATGRWSAARSRRDFEFDGFELAPKDWKPG